MISQDKYDLYDEVVAFIEHARRAGLEDLGLLDRMSRFRDGSYVNPSSIVWNAHKTMVNTEVAKFRNYKLYIFKHDYYFHPVYRCIIIDGDEMVYSDEAPTSELLKTRILDRLRSIGATIEHTKRSVR